MSMDLTAVSTALVDFGGQVLKEKLTTWDLQEDFTIRRNVTTPQALPKLKTQGNPRPYRKQDDFTGNDPLFTDQTLTVHQSKWDFDMDFEDLRNSYLALCGNKKLNPNENPFTDFVVQHYANSYLSKLYTSTVGAGSYNSAGTTAAACATGILTLIVNDLAAGTPQLTPIATGAFASTDAVTKVETFCDGLPVWMLQEGFDIFCSHTVFQKYKKHYRTLNGFGFTTGSATEYMLDGYKGRLKPRGWMGTSARLIATPNTGDSLSEKVLYMGTNDGAIGIYPTVHLNIIQARLLFPIGFQISDYGAIFVNDQA